MSDSVLKIFSYLPNPRVWKAQIAAELIGIDLEVMGDKPMELANWLWDFNARPLPESERSEDSRSIDLVAPVKLRDQGVPRAGPAGLAQSDRRVEPDGRVRRCQRLHQSTVDGRFVARLRCGLDG